MNVFNEQLYIYLLNNLWFLENLLTHFLYILFQTLNPYNFLQEYQLDNQYL